MIAQTTTKQEFDETVWIVAPKKSDVIDVDNLTPGEIVSLWWLGHYRLNEKTHIPKYFKKAYAVDLKRQKELFEKNGFLKETNHKTVLTDSGNSLINKYEWVILEHKEGANTPWGNGRYLLSQKDISLLPKLASGYKFPQNEILPDEFISLDIETTGLDEKFDQVTQLSAIHVKNNQEIEHFDTFIASDQGIGDFASKLTNITSETLTNAPRLQEVETELKSFIAGLTIVGWNIKRFDVHFLAEKGIDLSDCQIIDLMLCAKNYNHKGVNNTLTTVKRMIGIKSVAHNSLADARATALVGAKLDMFVKKGKSNNSFKQSIKKKKFAEFEYDDDSPIFEGLNFVFTGKIEDGKYDRPQMEYIVKKHGGRVSSTLSSKTDFFIKGVQTPGNPIHSSKELKFKELKDSGVDIYMTSGGGFDKLLNDYKENVLY